MNIINIQVSPQDIDLLGGWKQNRKVHADGSLYRYKKIGHAFQKEFLHRLVAARILAAKHKRLTSRVRVRFKDKDVTNCTRENIVLVDYATQGRLAIRVKRKTSKYRGVYRERDRWRVKIRYPVANSHLVKNKVKYKTEHIGYYPLDQEEVAARAYDKRARQIFPDAVVNFPEDFIEDTQAGQKVDIAT